MGEQTETRLKNRSAVCKFPPELKRKKQLHKHRKIILAVSLTFILTTTGLQLGAVCVYLLLGVISFQNLLVVERILFAYDTSYYGLWPYWLPSDFAAFFSATIMPLVLGVIGLIVVYGIWKEIKHSGKVLVLFNILGLIVILLIFGPILATVLKDYSAPPGVPPESWVAFLHSYDPYFLVLFPLVPVVVILSITAAIYTLAVGLGRALKGG